MITSSRTPFLESVTDAFRRIGYADHLLLRDYQFADFCSSSAIDRQIDLAIFGQEPPDYRSACFGIRAGEGLDDVTKILPFRALGAPQIFNVVNGATEQWKIGESDPVRIDVFPSAELPKRILSNIEVWNPAGILRAKQGFRSPGARQLDFVDIGLLPALDHEAGQKIDHLVASLLHRIEGEHKRIQKKFDARTIYDILFRFLAAKLLKDRGVTTVPPINFTDPDSVMLAVQNHYRKTHIGTPAQLPKSLLNDISVEIESTFSFRNISVDTLTYVYENTLVTPETRRRLGIHSTPPYIADFILSEIPFEEIPREQWRVIDPTCGHGIFLIAAMRRMRTLMDPSWSGPQRHQFLVERLTGIDIEAFAIEVARMCLILADFPEPNGWQLKQADAFAEGVIEREAKIAKILVGNPPFERLEGAERETPKPAILLDRVLPTMEPGSFLGIVLPKSFLNGADYKRQRQKLLSDWDIISVTSLPDRVFTHSGYETAAIVARRHDERKGASVAVYREVRDAEREVFERRHQASWIDEVPQNYFLTQSNHQIIVPFLRELWDWLASNPRLGDIADVRIGVQFDPEAIGGNLNSVVFDRPKRDTLPAISTISDRFFQYHCEDEVYFSSRTDVRRRNAWAYPWHLPKLIVPAARLGRHPWRISAVLDRRGRLASRNFFAVWPTDETVSVEALAALLNSPLAAGYMHSHSARKDNNRRDYLNIPIPSIIKLREADADLRSAVTSYLAAVESNHPDQAVLRARLLRIDAMVLRLYGLPPRLERKLLDLFWDEPRRVPFEFNGYVSPDQTSWIPLHILISEEYKHADVASVMNRLPIVTDTDLIDLLKTIGTGGTDS